jgi:dTDP-4-dehydrorhamnose 3,5-epimerase
MPAEVIPTPFEGLFFLRFPVFFDDRGYFTETYNRTALQEIGISHDFVQDNISLSKKNVLRGLHFQSPPHAQAKLVRVVSGRVLDVVVDIRSKSATYGQHFQCELTADNKQLYIPEGFAHGFLSLEENTTVAYKCSNTYNKNSECGLPWNDPDLAIRWGIEKPLLSEKDEMYSSFKEFTSPF